MNTIQRITKNVSVLFISQMFSYILGFFTTMYSARYLGVEGYGTLALAMAFAGIFTVLMDLGLNTLIIREIARNKSLTQNYAANVILIKILLSIITFFLILLITNTLGYNQETLYTIYCITLYTIFSTFSLLFYSIFQAHEKMEYKSLGVILSSILVLSGVLLAIHYEVNIIQFALIYSVVGVLILAYTIFIFTWKFSFPKIHFNKDLWVNLIKEAWPFGVTGISLSIYAWIDTIILSSIQGQGAVGLYNASYNLMVVLLFIPIVFNNALFPLMSQYYLSSKKSLNITFEKLLKVMLIIALPLGVGTLLIADQIIFLIYGNEFNGSIIALQILIWSTVLTFIRSPFERLLESSNRQLTVTKIFIISTIFNICFNLIVIKSYSYVGAAIVNVMTDLLVLSIIMITVKKIKIITLPADMKISIIKISLASITMGIILYPFKTLNLFLVIIGGVMIYITALILLKVFNKEEKLMIKSILSK